MQKNKQEKKMSKDIAKRDKILKSLKKIIKRNRYFQQLTCDTGKVKNGLRRLEVEEDDNDFSTCNKMK